MYKDGYLSAKPEYSTNSSRKSQKESIETNRWRALFKSKRVFNANMCACYAHSFCIIPFATILLPFRLCIGNRAPSVKIINDPIYCVYTCMLCTKKKS